MTTGSWFVLCRRDRLLSLTEIVPRLLPLTNARVETLEPEFMEIIVDDALTGNRATIEVYKDAEPHVLLESQELADDFEDIRSDVDAIAKADARYVLTWDLRYGDETYNTMLAVAERLAEACDGIIYDTTTGDILWSAHET